MDFIHIVMPLGDGVSNDDIPEDIQEAAKKSVEMWGNFIKSENERRIEELKMEIEKAKIELLSPMPYSMFTPAPGSFEWR